jgi:opacity protein-like surface antigen
MRKENAMKRWVLAFGALLLFSAAASAQDENPKVEVFGGYSYLRFNPGFSAPGLNFNGGSGSISYNLNSWLGIVGDIGGYHWSRSSVDATAVSYLFGPKIALRRGPVTPFVHTLFGGAHGSGAISGVCVDTRVRPEATCRISGSDNAFAMALGGGLDWNATTHIGVRLIQAEYVMTRFVSNTQNNARISAGVVFRF